MFLTPDLTRLLAACLLWKMSPSLLWHYSCYHLCSSHFARSYYQSRRGNFLIFLKRFLELQAVVMIQCFLSLDLIIPIVRMLSCIPSMESVKSVASINDVSSISLKINGSLWIPCSCTSVPRLFLLIFFILICVQVWSFGLKTILIWVFEVFVMFP